MFISFSLIFVDFNFIEVYSELMLINVVALGYVGRLQENNFQKNKATIGLSLLLPCGLCVTVEILL